MSDEPGSQDPPQSVYVFAFMLVFVLLIVTMFQYPIFEPLNFGLYMCGIGGMLSNPDAHVLHCMNHHQHRGPDGQNIWLMNSGLAHATMIVDLEWNQPINPTMVLL